MDKNLENMIIEPQRLHISDKKELYKSYISFLKGGGLFLPFNNEVNVSNIYPNQNITIIFSMLDNKEPKVIVGKVVWINRGAVNKGYGVAFDDTPEMTLLNEQIQSNIIDISHKKEKNYTL